MSDPADLTARALLSAYAGGKLSPVEVMQAVIRRIEAWEPKLNALYAYDPEPLLAEAHASEERWRTGGTLALDGVPVTVKENIATRGTPVPLGTAATSLSAAENDAPAPARLREAGAIIIAKTTMPDYGMLSSGLSSFHPLTRNPWNRGPAPPRRRATARSISAPTSAARCGCRRPGAGWWASSRALAGCRSIRPITAGPPGR
jgi:aspartyl-tRNA(Asn)/glutamyl-tRNA(Gln) amidotransferase subunit A